MHYYLWQLLFCISHQNASDHYTQVLKLLEHSLWLWFTTASRIIPFFLHFWNYLIFFQKILFFHIYLYYENMGTNVKNKMEQVVRCTLYYIFLKLKNSEEDANFHSWHRASRMKFAFIKLRAEKILCPTPHASSFWRTTK